MATYVSRTRHISQPTATTRVTIPNFYIVTVSFRKTVESVDMVKEPGASIEL